MEINFSFFYASQLFLPWYVKVFQHHDIFFSYSLEFYIILEEEFPSPKLRFKKPHSHSIFHRKNFIITS